MKVKILLGLLISVLAFGYLLPEPKTIPVAGATRQDWNPKTYWYEPWGASGVHKGVDIFAASGTPVISPTNMLILYRGEIARGGNIIVGLGPRWRIHYFAHLNTLDTNSGRLSAVGRQIATVGSTGNAAGKSPHLHYAILSLMPLPWRIDRSTQGYKKAFYLNPGEYLLE